MSNIDIDPIKGASVSRHTDKVIDDEIKRLARVIKRLEEVPVQILAEEAPRIEEEAKMLTPYKSGKLESSVTVKVAHNKRTPGIYGYAVAKKKGYDYAAVQHEVPFKHPIKGETKYLEKPFKRGVERIIRRIEEECLP